MSTEFIEDEPATVEATVGKLRRLIAEMLSQFTERGHPGEACLRTGWIRESTVAAWHQQYRVTEHVIVDRNDDADTCPHCEPRHGSPNRCAWGVRLGPALAANATGPVAPLALERDSDGQPVYLYVAPTNGAHVAQEDADWLFDLIRTRSSIEAVHELHAEVELLRRTLKGIYDLAVRDNVTGTLHAALNLHTLLDSET